MRHLTNAVIEKKLCQTFCLFLELRGLCALSNQPHKQKHNNELNKKKKQNKTHFLSTKKSLAFILYCNYLSLL